MLVDPDPAKIFLTNSDLGSYEPDRLQALDAPFGVMACCRISENEKEISKLTSWGGPRANSGGARPGAGRKPATAPVRQPTGLRWYAVEAKSGKIHQAANAIREKGFQPFIPTMAVRVRETLAGKRNSQFSTVHRPMFYQWLFARFDVDHDQWPAIRYADGVARLLMTSALRPVPVERGLVESLIESQQERAQLPDVGLKRLPIDLAVLINQGPFQGHVAHVVACDGFTTTVRINLLGGYREVRLPRKQIGDE